MDSPRQDFDSHEDGQILRSGAERLKGSPDERTSIAHLVGIFGEINRLAAKSRLVFGVVKTGTGLTGAEITTLVAIVHSSAPPTVAQLGRFLGHPRQVVQRAIKVLDRDGFIVIAPNPNHKRAPLLRPTTKGSKTVARVDATTRTIVDGLADGCDLERLAATHDGLLMLREHVDRSLGVEDY